MSDNDSPPKYSNDISVMHSANEFFLDFATQYPTDLPETGGIAPIRREVAGRFAITPPQAKALMRAFVENVRRYEKKYGEIIVPQSSIVKITLN